MALEAKRQRISDLIHVHLGNQEIANIVGCGLTTVKKVRRLVKEDKSIKRRPGSGGHNRKP